MISLSGILFLVGCHELLNIFWMIRYAVFAQESATIFGDEYIVLNSDTTEIFIGLNLVEVEEFCTVTGCLPVVDEGRDEVNSRLVGYHKTFLQTATHTQAVGTELLQIRAYLFVETNVNLVEVLHVVNIHSHHVAQTMRQEHGVCSSLYSLFCITLCKSELLHAVEEQAANREVYVSPFYAWLGYIQCMVVAFFYNRVDFQLALAELSAHRHGAGVV